MSARRHTKPKRLKPSPTTHDVAVEAYDGQTYTGTYQAEGGLVTVRTPSGDHVSAASAGMYNDCLAKMMLLGLNGKPRVTWPEGWMPEGCPDWF